MQTAPQNSILSVIESTTINQDSSQSTFLLCLWMQENVWDLVLVERGTKLFVVWTRFKLSAAQGILIS